VLYVTVKGKVNEETGFIINLKELSRIIKEFVFDHVDHRNLNLDVEFLKGQITSSENFAKAIWKQLETPIRENGGVLAKIILEETENNIVEYYGGKEPY
jgi:6-pyruvoyltetrahydropterin/6-carboxytetrahydropterin synthase